MKRLNRNQGRFIVGLILVIAAAALLVFSDGSGSMAGAIALGVLGIWAIAVSGRKAK
jgi:hypothetical protein